MREMEYYKPIKKVGTHLADSKQIIGAKSGNLLNNTNNKANGSAAWIKVSDLEITKDLVINNKGKVVGIGLLLLGIGAGIGYLTSKKKHKKEKELQLKQIQEEINNNSDKIIKFEEGKQELIKNKYFEIIEDNSNDEINDKGNEKEVI